MFKVFSITFIAAIIIFAGLFSLHFILKSEAAKAVPVSVQPGEAGEAGVNLLPSNSWRFKINQENHPVSVFMLCLVLVLQFFALLVIWHIVSNLKKEDSPPDLKLEKLQNADIFLDLPLYIGLFGTVISFIIITFSPQMGRLIAYSSTIIGIIISVILRTTLLYPYRQSLIIQSNQSDNGEKSK